MHPILRSFTVRFLVWPEVKTAIRKILGRDPDTTLFAEAVSSRAFNLPFDKYHARDFTALFLYVYVREVKPDVVVETGISSGRSSTTILEALNKNGKGTLYSIDLPKLNDNGETTIVSLHGNTYRQYIPKDATEPGWLVPEDLKSRWQKILEDSNVALPKLVPTLSKIDIFFHDGDHTDRTMMHEFEVTWPLLPPGGLLLADDIPSSRAFYDFVQKTKHGVRHEYNGLGILTKPK
jgi:predicted O-methyltransferase YrrM